MTAGAPTSTFSKALSQLGFAEPPSADLEGLRSLYKAWCLGVPFDNVRKTIAMRTNAPGSLPGAEADDFFEAWVEHGTGGTCWPINNAWYALLKSLGFDAIRATGSIWDLGIDNHGTVIVSIDGQEWVADAALETMHLLPLSRGEVHISDDPVYKAEIDPEGDGFFIWAVHPPVPHLLPCRLLESDVAHDLFAANYERSREMSPFNAKLYARKNFEEELRVLAGNRLFVISPSGQKVTELSGDELMAELRTTFKYGEKILDEWVACGGLEASLAQTEPPPKPPLTRTPPSERR